jgi:hypothetical protein
MRVRELQERCGPYRSNGRVNPQELDEARKLAIENGQLSAAVAATIGKAKVAGLIVERKEAGEPGEFEALRLGVAPARG